MLSRLFPISIVVFWLFSMGWLCAVVWAPPESRMSRIDPMEVYEVFFAWNETTNMTLLENGARRGQITISGGSGEDSETGIFTNSLSVSGMLENQEEEIGSRAIDLFWKGLIEFSEEMAMQTGDFSIRVPKRQSTAHLSLERKGDDSESSGESMPYIFRARALINKLEIFSFDSSESGATALPLQMLPMGSMVGLDSLDAQSLKFDAEARMGKFSFGGRDLRAYLLILKMKDKEGAIRIYISEAGEPLRLETDLGFEAISEILVPLDAYKEVRKEKNT